MAKRIVGFGVFFVVFIFVACSTVQDKNVAVSSVLAVPPAPPSEPAPILTIRAPALVSGGSGAVLLQSSLEITIPGTAPCSLLRLDVTPVLRSKDRDVPLQAELSRLPDGEVGEPFPEPGDTEPLAATTAVPLQPNSGNRWRLTLRLPLEDILTVLPEKPEETQTPEILDIQAKAVLLDAAGQSYSLGAHQMAPLPRIYWPEVRIVSIAVKRAELINTRLKVRLSINNPNGFPLTLSRFSYELYGNGRFWADGNMEDIFTVQGQEELEKDIYLIMNFINMRRDLLDQVIALKSVQYRFHGDLIIGTPLEYLPAFPYSFDRKGASPVIE